MSVAAMKPLSRDTPLEVEKVWLEGLRQRGGLFQLQRLAELIHLGRQAEREAIRRARPGSVQVELDEALLQELYGKEAAHNVVALRVKLGFYE
jgi:hypothetical protein